MSNGLGDVPSSAKETLIKLLHETLSLHQETREVAEQEIKALEVTEEFGIHLAEILVDSAGEIVARLLASTNLQLYVETRWQNWFNIEPESPEIKLESKEKIKGLLCHGLRDSTCEIRQAVAQTICTIAHADWPENWPGLYDVLVDCLSQESDFAIDEAMRVLRTCIRHVGNAQLPNIGPVILQAMYQIFQDGDQYSVLIRSQAAEIFTTIVSFLVIPNYCEKDFIHQSIQPIIPMFCEKFMQTLTEKNESTHNNCLKINVIKAIRMLTATLPKYILDFLSQMLSLILETLVDSAKAYREHTVDEEEDFDDQDINSDEEVVDDCNTLIKTIFEFISVLIDGPHIYISHLSEYGLSNYQWFFLQDSLLAEAIQHFIIFMELTDKQINLWTHNPSQFLIEGEIDVMSNSIRGIARDLLIKIVDHPERAAANALFVVVLKYIEAENASRISSNSTATQNPWKSHETFLLAFCIVKNIIVEKQKAEMLHFDVVAFLKNVVLADLNNSESHPLLVSRCLYLGGLYADQMPPKLLSRFLEATTNGLNSRTACVKICAAIAANCWFAASIEKNNDDECALKSHLPAMFQGLFDLGSQLMTAEGLKLILENFTVLVMLDKTFTVSVERKICTLTIAALRNFYNDFSIIWVCEKIFRELSLHPKCTEPLQVRLVPELIKMMTINSSGKVALDILQILVKHSPQPLSSVLIESAFLGSCNFILSSGDHATLQSGSELMRTYCSMAAQQVISYRDNNYKTGVQYILQIASKLLKPQTSDFRIEDACELIKFSINTAGDTFSENTSMQQLVAAMLCKMQCTRRIFVRKLLMVFAHLFNTHFDIILNALSIIPGPTEQSTLAFVVSNGFCKEHQFFEHNDRKIVNLALSKVLEHSVTHHESELREAAPQGTEDEARTIVPLLVEICKHVSNELS